MSTPKALYELETNIFDQVTRVLKPLSDYFDKEVVWQLIRDYEEDYTNIDALEKELLPLIYHEDDKVAIPVLHLLSFMQRHAHDLTRLSDDRLAIIIKGGTFSHGINPFIDIGDKRLAEVLMKNLPIDYPYCDEYVGQELTTVDRLKFVLNHRGMRYALEPEHLDNEAFIDVLALEYAQNLYWMPPSNPTLVAAKRKAQCAIFLSI
jgi:hypothetical protein